MDTCRAPIRSRPTACPGRDRGFTLIELLAVVAILGIIAAIAVPIFARQRVKASVATMRSDVVTIRTGLTAYHAEKDTFGPEETINDGGGAVGPALLGFAFRASPRNSVTTIHDDDAASFCVVVTNRAAATVVTYGQGNGTIALGCTAGYTVSATGEPVTPTGSPAPAQTGVAVVSPPVTRDSPVCKGPASLQAKANIGCPAPYFPAGPGR